MIPMISRRKLILSMSAAALAGERAMAGSAGRISLPDLYATGVGPTDYARELEGRSVRAEGFMAPPLRAESRFFVLTTTPMSVCPFCDEEEEWGQEILAIYARRPVTVTPFYQRIAVRGVLRLGAYRDPETGFLSQLRLEEASYDRM